MWSGVGLVISLCSKKNLHVREKNLSGNKYSLVWTKQYGSKKTLVENYILYSYLVAVFLHVSQSIFVGINEEELVSVELDSTANVQVFSLVVDRRIGF